MVKAIKKPVKASGKKKKEKYNQAKLISIELI